MLNNALWPINPTLENYRVVFSSQNNFGYALRNSIIIASSATLIGMIVGVFSAYALARLEFRGKLIWGGSRQDCLGEESVRSCHHAAGAVHGRSSRRRTPRRGR